MSSGYRRSVTPMRRVLALSALALVLAGCGGGDDEAAPPPAAPTPAGTETLTTPDASSTSGTPTSPEPLTLSVYFLRDGKVAAARRSVEPTEAVARAALETLLEGPTAAEREAGLTSRVPRETTIEALAIAEGTATLRLEPCPAAMEQVVFTLTQFASVRRVESPCLAGGRPVGRADLERAMPAILVESPTVGELVTSPLRLRGSANTFEANFVVNVVDWDGRIVRETFVTATSGSGTRGTFDAVVPFDVDRPGGALIVFEQSAEDGSQINVVEIPLRLQPS